MGGLAAFDGAQRSDKVATGEQPGSVVSISDGGDPLKFAEVAVRALGLLVENTGCVVVPYLDHPSLLGDLLEVLQIGGGGSASQSGSGSGGTSSGHIGAASQGGSWAVRREIMRLLGILGALDPYRLRMACIAAAQRSALATQVRCLPVARVV